MTQVDNRHTKALTTFPDRLRKLVDTETEEGSFAEFCRRISADYSGAHKWFDGAFPSYEMLVRIRLAFGTDINWLLTGHRSR